MTKYLPASLAVFILLSFAVSAQVDPLFSNYMFNKMIYNPAAAGSDTGYITARGLFDDQWLNFYDPEGASAPVSESGSMDGAIRLKSKQFYLGAGLSYSHYIGGFISQNEYLVSASCHYLPAFGGNLSFGINAGAVNFHIAPNWIDGLYQLPPGNTNNGFEAGFGLYYSAKDYYIGISAFNIPKPNLLWGPNGGYSFYFPLYPTYTLSGGYNFFFNHNKNLELQPSFFIENHYGTYPCAVSCLFLYNQRFWAGLDFKGYDLTSSSVLAGVIIVKGKFGDIRAGGAYEYVTSAPVAFGGALELMLSGRVKI